MLVWIPITYISLIIAILFFIRRSPNEIPVFINGLIPSLSNAKNKEQSGTTVYIFYTDTFDEDEPEAIFRGYADQEGTVSLKSAASNVGRSVEVRIRHSMFKPEEFKMTIPRYGIIHTAKMEPDFVFDEKYRGAQVGDLQSHYEKAITSADEFRGSAINIARRVGRTLAQIPIVFWLAAYTAVIFACALDYYHNSELFYVPLESLVHAVYFSVVTITTLGYGDSYPTHDLIRMACSLEAISGVLVIGLFLNSLFYERRQ